MTIARVALRFAVFITAILMPLILCALFLGRALPFSGELRYTNYNFNLRRTDLWSADVDRNLNIPLTSFDGVYRVVHWSPGGNQALIFNYDDLEYAFIDLHNQSYRTTQGQPTWSPNGEYFVYWHAGSSENAVEIYIDGYAFSGSRLLMSASGTLVYPFWSPNSDYLILAVVNPPTLTLWRIDINATNHIVLAESLSGYLTLPVWSADRSRFVLSVSDDLVTYDVWLFDANGDNGRSVLRSESFIKWITWLPDGSSLLLGFNSMIQRVALATGNIETFLQVTDSSRPNWSPDTTWIAFWGGESTSRKLYIVDLQDEHSHEFSISGVSSLNNMLWSYDSRYLYGSTTEGSDFIIEFGVDVSLHIVKSRVFLGASDGRQLMFIRGGRLNGYSICLSEFDNTNLRCLSSMDWYPEDIFLIR